MFKTSDPCGLRGCRGAGKQQKQTPPAKICHHLVTVDGLASIFFVLLEKNLSASRRNQNANRRVLPRCYFGAREATICSKRGSPRNGSQNGSSFNWP